MKVIFTLILSILVITSKSQTIGDQLISNTIKIQSFKDLKWRHPSSGSGFFLSYILGRDTIPVIVTNKHVIENSDIGILKFNSRSGNLVNYGDIITITLHNFSKLWIEDPNEDLAILPLAPIIQAAALHQKQLFCVYFNVNQILNKENEKDFNAIEDVYMIGYPKGLSDTINNLPIVRKGITATPTYINYNGKDHLLLDIPTYPGSSGSPIIQYKESGYTDRNGSFLVGQPKILLIGIAVESREYAAKGETEKINGKKIETTTWLPFGIAEVIKAYRLLDFEPILKKLLKNSQLPTLIMNNTSVSY
jgi:V8-like Glu-specific endopeptidase